MAKEKRELTQNKMAEDAESDIAICNCFVDETSTERFLLKL